MNMFSLNFTCTFTFFALWEGLLSVSLHLCVMTIKDIELNCTVHFFQPGKHTALCAFIYPFTSLHKSIVLTINLSIETNQYFRSHSYTDIYHHLSLVPPWTYFLLFVALFLSFLSCSPYVGYVSGTAAKIDFGNWIEICWSQEEQ